MFHDPTINLSRFVTPLIVKCCLLSHFVLLTESLEQADIKEIMVSRKYSNLINFLCIPDA